MYIFPCVGFYSTCSGEHPQHYEHKRFLHVFPPRVLCDKDPHKCNRKHVGFSFHNRRINRCIYFYVMFSIKKQTYIERTTVTTIFGFLGKDSSRFTHNCMVTEGITQAFLQVTNQKASPCREQVGKGKDFVPGGFLF